MTQILMSKSDQLSQVPLFAGLSARRLREVAAVVEWRRFADTDVLCSAGRPARELFVVTKGIVCLRRIGDPANWVTAGGHFGASTANAVRAAKYDAAAEGDVVVVAIGWEELTALILEEPAVRARLDGVESHA